jgi:hypothetical protein
VSYHVSQVRNRCLFGARVVGTPTLRSLVFSSYDVFIELPTWSLIGNLNDFVHKLVVTLRIKPRLAPIRACLVHGESVSCSFAILYLPLSFPSTVNYNITLTPEPPHTAHPRCSGTSHAPFLTTYHPLSQSQLPLLHPERLWNLFACLPLQMHYLLWRNAEGIASAVSELIPVSNGWCIQGNQTSAHMSYPGVADFFGRSGTSWDSVLASDLFWGSWACPARTMDASFLWEFYMLHRCRRLTYLCCIGR